MIFRNVRLQKFVSVVLLIAFGTFVSGCKFYRVKSGDVGEGITTKTLYKSRHTNFYVLHIGNALWEYYDVEVSESQIKGKLRELNSEAMSMYKRMNEEGSTRVLRKEAAYVYQVHIFAEKMTKVEDWVTVLEKDVTKLDVYDMNTGKNVASVAGTAILAAAGGFGLLIIVACATACPHVYVYNGHTYYFNNSLFTGAIAPQLERDDFKVMPDYFPDADTYQFYVLNEKQEEQFTNLLELIVVQHPFDVEVYADQKGNLYTVADPMIPERIWDDGDRDLKELAGYHDGRAFVFNNPDAPDMSNLYASFDRPDQLEHGKLIIQVKNTEWSGHVYHEFTKLFGGKYDHWVERNRKKKSREEMEADLQRMGMTMTVSIKSNNEWVDLDVIDFVGSISYNGIAIPIDAELLDQDKIEVRVTAGYYFWKLDYLALDCSQPQEISEQRLTPYIASGNRNMNYVSELSLDDNLYMEHPFTGDSTYVEYHGLKTNPLLNRTVILHSKGYYIPTVEHEGKFERSELVQIGKSYAGLSVFSKQLYDEQFGGLSLRLE